MLLMGYNVFRTINAGQAVDAKIPALAANSHA